MQISINNISFNGYTKNAPVNTVESETQKSSTLNLKLSNYEVGQAILNRNNISFRNLTTPIEVTDKYNKKTEGKDHLDLPNIHVYEYPDTNLQVIMNIDDHISTNDKNFLEQPQILVQILNNSNDAKKENVKNELIKKIIETNLDKKAPFILNNEGYAENIFYSYTEWGGKNVIDNLQNLNQTVYDLRINEQDLISAKYELSKKYTNENFDAITAKNLQEYYNGLKNNISSKAFVTVSKDYFEKNHKRIFSELNRNIDIRLQKNNSNNNLLKKQLLDEFTLGIINSYTDFNRNFKIINSMNDYSNYKVICKNQYDKNLFIQLLNKLLNEDLDKIIKMGKLSYKKEIIGQLTEQEIPLLKNITLAHYGNNFSQIENLIDSINQNDVKQNIRMILMQYESDMGKDYNENY